MKYYRTPIILFLTLLIIDLILTCILGWNRVINALVQNTDFWTFVSLLNFAFSIWSFNMAYKTYKGR